MVGDSAVVKVIAIGSGGEKKRLGRRMIPFHAALEHLARVAGKAIKDGRGRGISLSTAAYKIQRINVDFRAAAYRSSSPLCLSDSRGFNDEQYYHVLSYV